MGKRPESKRHRADVWITDLVGLLALNAPRQMCGFVVSLRLSGETMIIDSFLHVVTVR